jgi:hypothetical protein
MVGLAMISPATPAWAPPFENAEGLFVRTALIFRTLAMNGRQRAQSQMAIIHLNGTGARQSDVQGYA